MQEPLIFDASEPGAYADLMQGFTTLLYQMTEHSQAALKVMEILEENEIEGAADEAEIKFLHDNLQEDFTKEMGVRELRISEIQNLKDGLKDVTYWDEQEKLQAIKLLFQTLIIRCSHELASVDDEPTKGLFEDQIVAQATMRITHYAKALRAIGSGLDAYDWYPFDEQVSWEQARRTHGAPFLWKSFYIKLLSTLYYKQHFGGVRILFVLLFLDFYGY